MACLDRCPVVAGTVLPRAFPQPFPSAQRRRSLLAVIDRTLPLRQDVVMAPSQLIEAALELKPALVGRRQGHPSEGGRVKVECSKCKTVPFPRGFDATVGLCWTCSFPRQP